ncbi:MAG: carboxypeptidase-like regulatory domain-containing protein [Acidobacteria bacterium]|nr:carboxypeptidase-like regulatory domain-containing protein [Acidobacteriota bacterium]
MTKLIAVLMLLALSLGIVVGEDSTEAPEPGFGGVAGHVADVDGNPVDKAEVYCQLVAEPGMGGRASVFTDVNGKFFLNRVLPGTNAIHASKPDDGYPDTMFAFFVKDSRRVPQVLVQEGSVTTGLLVRLGPKAGRLTGRIVDSDTGAAVVRSEIRLYHQGNPDVYVLTAPDEQGKFDFLVPAVKVGLRVTARGFQNWEYGGISNAAILIEGGGAKEVHVALKPRK